MWKLFTEQNPVQKSLRFVSFFILWVQMLVRWVTVMCLLDCLSLWVCHLQLESFVPSRWEHPLLLFCCEGENLRSCSQEDFACVLDSSWSPIYVCDPL